MTEKFALKIASTAGSKLMVEFSNLGDRWSNRWVLVDGDVEIEIMTSAEGTPEQDWPPSPPLQDISGHELPTGNAILGVGMAGKSHWSASVVAASETNDRQLIRCEWACLRKDETELQDSKAKLSSNFSVSDGFSFDSLTDGRMELTSNESRTKLILEPVVGEQWSSRIEVNDKMLSIQPTVYSNSPVRSTQWGLTIRFCEAAADQAD